MDLERNLNIAAESYNQKFDMIKYSLKCVEENCNKNEPFDGWFQNSASFEKQIDAGYISCPYCGSLNIKKNLMSPSVKSIREKTPKII